MLCQVSHTAPKGVIDQPNCKKVHILDLRFLKQNKTFTYNGFKWKICLFFGYYTFVGTEKLFLACQYEQTCQTSKTGHKTRKCLRVKYPYLGFKVLNLEY